MRRSWSLGFFLLAACGGVGSDATNEGSVPPVSLGGSGGAGGGHGGTSVGGASGHGGAIGGTSAGGSGGVKPSGGSGGSAGSTTGGTGGKGGAGTGGGSTGGSSTGGKGGSTGTGGSAGTGGGTMTCAAGQIVCEGFQAKVCDGKGGYTSMMACSSGCAPGLGCVACIPNTGSCNGDTAMHCKSDGSGYVTENCDPTIGLTCDPKTFSCTGACAAANLGSSYLGCEYWPTTVANQVWSNFDFAVAVANPEGSQPAMITVDRAGATVATAMVAPGNLEIIKLPWVSEVKGPDFGPLTNVVPEGPTRFVAGGAYRLRSTTPVSVYQFNALEYTLTSSDPGYASCPGLQSGVGCNSYSNDASLLLPTNALTGHYSIFTYPSWDQASLPDYVAITATTDGTNVAFLASTQVQAGGPLGALGPGQTGTFTMNAGDVIEIMANPTGSDITGSAISADKPLSVIAGVPCRFIPDGAQACDHIEESILPVETLGSEYLITAPQTPDGVKLHEVRVLAVQDGTTITIDPPSPQGATISLNSGQVASFGVVGGDYHLTSTNRFYVSQYMVGGTSFPDSMNDGDPSQSNGVPVQQYRTDYTFLAPSSYNVNMVNVTAPTSATVTLDGAPIAASQFTPIGSSGFGVARVQLSMSQVHKLTATAQVGIVVYGYGSYTSYMYPGGMNLTKL